MTSDGREMNMRPGPHRHTLGNFSLIVPMLAVVMPSGRLQAQDPVITTKAPPTNLGALECRTKTVADGDLFPLPLASHFDEQMSVAPTSRGCREGNLARR
jgi:hypothetical protein